MHLLTITNTNLRVSTYLTVNALLGMIVPIPLGICPLCVFSQNCVPLGGKIVIHWDNFPGSTVPIKALMWKFCIWSPKLEKFSRILVVSIRRLAPPPPSRGRNSFSHDSSGPPVRTHLHTANQSLHDMNMNDLRLRNKSTHARGLVILL